MVREGIMDVDSTIVKLSKMVPVLQIEALGNTAEDVVKEAHRQLDLGLDPKKTVFKIPVSLEGLRACNMLRKQDLMVNVHLVYTLQQAYMAMHAGASYVCPLVGRLQDQGHDALVIGNAERRRIATPIQKIIAVLNLHMPGSAHIGRLQAIFDGIDKAAEQQNGDNTQHHRQQCRQRTAAVTHQIAQGQRE